jgi:hypothetical protein
MVEFFLLIPNTIRGPFQTFLESPVLKLENQAKHFQVALQMSINKFNCTDPNIKALSGSFYNFLKITSGQSAAPIMFMHASTIFMMLILKGSQQI